VADNDTGDNLDKDWIIPSYLKQAGYQTSLVGKFITNWHRSYQLDPWFDSYAGLQGGYRNATFMVKDPGEDVRNEDSGEDSTDFIKDKAVQYLDAFEGAKDDQPWFMQISPHAPHDEVDEPLYTWPARYDDVDVPARPPNPAFDLEGAGNPVPTEAVEAKSDKLPQLARKKSDSEFEKLVNIEQHGQLKTLLAADDMIDEVMKALERNGELDNTLVIFTSDNGYFLGERNVDSKGWPYGEGVSVPFWVRWAGVIPAAAVDTRPVGGEDILPTLLDAAQFTPPALKYDFDGRSFLPMNPAKPYKYLEFGPPAGPNPPGYAGHRDIPAWASIRTPTYQYIEYYQNDCSDQPDPCTLNGTLEFAEYYDLMTDPWQIDNLLSPTVTGKPQPDPALISELSRQVQAARTCAGTTGPQACP
jgi:arylsulfatase A-like enzyme